MNHRLDMCFRHVCIAAFALFAGCAVPRDAVLFSTKPASLCGPHFDQIPADWDGRLVRVGNANPLIGGLVEHVHSIIHTHEWVNPPTITQGTVNPLGLDEKVAGAIHIHPVRSTDCTPTNTAPGVNLPRSRELFGVIASRGAYRAPEGVVVIYTGNVVPPGWARCDLFDAGCNMSGLYVRLRRSQISPQPVGSDDHVHDDSHEHHWASGPPQNTTDIGYAVDHASSATAPSNGAAAPFDHVHLITDAGWQGMTLPSNAFPPTESVQFIVSITNAVKMPSGAVLAYQGKRTPFGWKPLSVIGGRQITGRFIRGEDAEHVAGTSFGSESHVHGMPHRHVLTMSSSAARSVPIRIVPATSVADSNHTHGVEISEEKLETGSGSSLPPFVELRLILKE